VVNILTIFLIANIMSGGEFMLKKDCFAIQGSKCIALNKLYCRKCECGFYKTSEQYKADIAKVNERLLLLSAVEFQGIDGKYDVFAKMLSQ